ncbi:ATM interactor isoform X1 [Choloepus didactylus]|uniref:ATM interactor-like n=2 Tax=Choloepus didactylus TaxID=27675 RepID=UPI00189E57CD|nr:ATM interactor-like [Choloepus didactylus]XP_037671930.1 ATM interactor isoform X1 [Choloepus didactylus]
MAASEAAAAGPAALGSGTLGAPAVPAAARGAAAASGPWGPPGRLRGSRPRPAAARQQPASPALPARELIQPSVSELSRAVRTNILCTVRGCGKILPNSPALNMHLVKSHRLQDGIVNPTIRKDLKTVPKFYCCPIEGCPRGPDRPFSQFSLVKQHFMKMHAEKKHKCSKCSNSYGTEWDLKRHAEDCGKTFQCTCGCPYASRTALQSHIYRTGHEIPAEHRDPPSKKRKMENSTNNQKLSKKTIESLINKPTSRPDTQELETSEIKVVASFEDSCSSNARKQTLKTPPRYPQKLLLPKPKVALVKLPVMQFSPVPVFVPTTADSSAQPVVVGVDHQGSAMGAVHLLPLSIGTLILGLDSEACSLKESLPLPKIVNPIAVEPVSTGVQVNLGKSPPPSLQQLGNTCQKHSISSINVQTDLSYSSPGFLPSAQWASPDSSVSSCSQTDLTFGSQVSLPISVHTQTLLPSSKVTSSIAAQTDAFLDDCFQSGGISRETQTSGVQSSTDDGVHMDQAIMCGDIFENVHSSYRVSTDSIISNSLVADTITHGLLSQNDPKTLNQDIEKSASIINFNEQNSILPSQNMTDNQTQTIDLLSDLENILSSNLPGQTLDNRSLLSDTNTEPDTQLSSGPTQNPGIDFDIEEFFSASNIQTQTEESELSNMNTEPVLESLDIETQTDFLLADTSAQSYSCRGNANFLGLEMFDTQTQTDLNFFLDSSPHLPLGSILKHSSFSMSTDSSDTETQTEGTSTKNLPALESKVQLNSTETQTMNSCFETLGSLFFTSNETQTAMDDFLLADLAWNTMESQFSSVETQTCAELQTVSNF